MHIQPLVLSGGSGTRLWPLSREKYPKQLLPLVDNDSLLQATVRRLQGIHGVELAAPMVVCNEEYRFVIAEQLRLMSTAHDTRRRESSNAIIELRRLLAEEQQRAKFTSVGSKDTDVHFVNAKTYEGGKVSGAKSEKS